MRSDHNVRPHFNRWLDEDWGIVYKDKICLPRPISRWPTWIGPATSWSGRWSEMRAPVLVMRPSAVFTRNGPTQSRRDPDFDPFWSRVNEAGITVVTHIGQTRHDSNGYDTKSIDVLSHGYRAPASPTSTGSRNINDFLASLVFDQACSNASRTCASHRWRTARSFWAKLLRFL